MRKGNSKIGRCLDVFLRKRGMTFICCLLSTTAYAECTPTPDCANIGYTETSCEGDSLKCPFDTSKLFCIPCDTSFKYDCNGDNMTGGIGDACGGKYASCTCSGGGEFNNGSCPQSCTVGMIYYSDKSCSAALDSTKTVIGVVVKDNALVMSEIVLKPWGGVYTHITGLTNYNYADALNDYNGKNNTALIVATHTELGLTSENSAAIYCNEYSISETSVGEWYFPALGELYDYVYGNFTVLDTAINNLGWSYWKPFHDEDTTNGYFWSATKGMSYPFYLVVYKGSYDSGKMEESAAPIT